MAYLRYDHHQRKGYHVSPTYKDYLRAAVVKGVSQADIHNLFSLLNVEIPSEIKL